MILRCSGPIDQDLDGNRTRVTWPDGLFAAYVYDYLNRVIQVEENGAVSGAGLLASYGYNDLGQMTGVARAGGAGASTAASYDPADRLSAFTHAFASSANDVTWSFGYNGGDQLVGRGATNDAYSFHPAAFAGVAYVANGLNEYASVGTVNYSYTDTDGGSRGNLTNDGVRTFSYDLENHLVSASAPTTSVTLTYDPLGRLQTSKAGGVTTTFLYDGSNLVGEYDSSGNLLNRYVFGPGVDDPLVWYQGAGTASRNWLHMDNQNSVVAWSNSSGALVGSRGYGPYGEPSAWSGPRFAYTGQIMIPEASLYHYKARVYDPGIGRFLQTDPIGYASDVNLYAYVGNDPVSGLDSGGTDTGSDTCPLCLSPNDVFPPRDYTGGLTATFGGFETSCSIPNPGPVDTGGGDVTGVVVVPQVCTISGSLTFSGGESGGGIPSGGGGYQGAIISVSFAPQNKGCLANVGSFVNAHLPDAQTLANELGNGVTPAEVLGTAGNETHYGGGFASIGNYFGLHGHGPAGTYYTSSNHTAVMEFSGGDTFLASGQVFVNNVGPYMQPGMGSNPLAFFSILNQHGYATGNSGYPAFMVAGGGNRGPYTLVNACLGGH